jgi:glycoside/pentoside/hexuronide:cation symporter, GPH family
VLGLPEWWVGLAILIALVVDALSDPVVGHLSDHWHSRFGRRHPFMYASAVPVGISFYLLWNPPAALGPEALFVWLVVVAIVVRTFITFYEIPSSSLVAELTQSYDERTSLLGVRYFFGWWGGLTMAILAFRVFLRPDADHPVGILNPHGYADYGIAAGLIMTATILLSAGGTHSFRG